jgi:hypothetical protein
MGALRLRSAQPTPCSVAFNGQALPRPPRARRRDAPPGRGGGRSSSGQGGQARWRPPPCECRRSCWPVSGEHTSPKGPPPNAVKHTVLERLLVKSARRRARACRARCGARLLLAGAAPSRALGPDRTVALKSRCEVGRAGPQVRGRRASGTPPTARPGRARRAPHTRASARAHSARGTPARGRRLVGPPHTRAARARGAILRLGKAAAHPATLCHPAGGRRRRRWRPAQRPRRAARGLGGGLRAPPPAPRLGRPASHLDPVLACNVAVPVGAHLGRALERVEVHVHEAKLLGVAVRPLKVVQQRPAVRIRIRGA